MEIWARGLHVSASSGWPKAKLHMEIWARGLHVSASSGWPKAKLHMEIWARGLHVSASSGWPKAKLHTGIWARGLHVSASSGRPKAKLHTRLWTMYKGTGRGPGACAGGGIVRGHYSVVLSLLQLSRTASSPSMPNALHFAFSWASA